MFTSETERMAHPQAKLIPYSMWHSKDLFNASISDKEIELMNTPTEELLSKLEQIDANTVSAENRRRLWLAIALSHKDLGNAGLTQMANKLVLGPNRLFEAASALGDMSFFDYLCTKINTQEAVIANERNAFCLAAENGHLQIMRYIIKNTPKHLREDLGFNRSTEAFDKAAANGHLDIMQYLLEKTLAEDRVTLISSFSSYKPFYGASRHGHLHIMKFLLHQSSGDEKNRMIRAWDYAAFRFAALNGYPGIMKFLIELKPAEKQKMIFAYESYVFREAAQKGELNVMEKVAAREPNRLQEIIASNNYEAFRKAVMHDHLQVVEYLKSIAPDHVVDMIAAEDYEAFAEATINGNRDLINYFIDKIPPNKLQDMLAAVDYRAFGLAAKNNHLEILQLLFLKVTPDKVQKIIASKDYALFRLAAQHNSLEMMTFLFQKAPDKMQEMIAAGRYEAFCSAARNGTLELLSFLGVKAPNKVQDMIAARNFEAFRSAAMNNHLAVIQFLIEQAPDKVQDMMAANNFEAFRSAAQGQNPTPITNLLMHNSAVFAYAEQHGHEYGSRFIYPFMQDKINDLREKKSQLEQESPNAVFDVQNSEEAKLLFYFLRNLIRRNDPALQDDILLLLDIPAVKALVHTEVSPNHANELLRLALRLGNQPAIQRLLDIPAVRDLAEQNDYYRNEMRGGIDLRVLAQDRESSMHALSTGEQKRLQAAIERYTPVLKDIKVPQIMNNLRQTLEERYAKNPATIEIKSETGAVSIITLPLKWDEFEKLNLGQNKDKALQAYYQNKDHSAWRYLEKPNPWMHKKAAYVCVNPDKPSERWSTFEDYQPLISMLFLAAKDKEVPPTDGFTLETRLEHFIDELASIGRSHNWDETRVRTNNQGKSVLEEYDNLEGDRPSCFSGVKRRLFQSVLGHPLLKVLTKADIEMEIRTFARDHFTQNINETNQRQIKESWDKMIMGEDMTEHDWVTLKSLDFSPDQQAHLISHLSSKYGFQFTDDEVFRNQVQSAFALRGKEDAHILNFGHAGVGQLLEQPKNETSSSIPSSGKAVVVEEGEDEEGDSELFSIA